MKNTSLKFRLNLWYTILMIFLGICILGVVMIAAHTSQRSHAQQTLIRSVERNVDEIEIENGILDIERDFAYRNSGVYSVVFNSAGEKIAGDYPDGINPELELDRSEVRKREFNDVDYFIYDSIMKFNKFEYRIDGKTGEILSSEAEYAAMVSKFDGDLDIKTEECELSLREAFELVLQQMNLKEEDVLLTMAQIHDYHYNNPVYEIEFFTDKAGYDDVWIRGVMRADSEDSVWDTVMILAFILLPVFIGTASLIGNLITKLAYKPIETLSQAVSRISSGDDLNERVVTKDGDPTLLQLENNCNMMLERLQASFVSEKQFTSDASHELRTPVTVILAECDYQLSRDDIGPEERESFIEIRKKALNMKQLITQLLYFARMEQGKMRFDFAPNDLSELVSAVCGDVGSIAGRGIKVSAHIQPGIIFNMDASLMARLVENLVSNAVRYGKENGRVDVTLEENGKEIILTVSDDGIGISSDDIDKIWQRFYRADKARSGDEGCSGLGLPMVKQIAILHGGKVSVESEEGVGSTFKVEFKV